MRAADLPYGPGNPDYEYDGWRSRKDNEEELLDLENELQQQQDYPPQGGPV